MTPSERPGSKRRKRKRPQPQGRRYKAPVVAAAVDDNLQKTAQSSMDPYQTFDYVSPRRKAGHIRATTTTARPRPTMQLKAPAVAAADKKALLIVSRSGIKSPVMAALKSEVREAEKIKLYYVWKKSELYDYDVKFKDFIFGFVILNSQLTRFIHL